MYQIADLYPSLHHFIDLFLFSLSFLCNNLLVKVLVFCFALYLVFLYFAIVFFRIYNSFMLAGVEISVTQSCWPWQWDRHDQLEDTAQATEWFMQLIGVAPTDTSVLARTGEIYDNEGDKSQAFQYYYDVSSGEVGIADHSVTITVWITVWPILMLKWLINENSCYFCQKWNLFKEF